MTTALTIIESALEEIGYKAAEVPVEASDIKIGLHKLNDMLAEWNDSGIQLGAMPVENPADTVRIPRGAVGAVKVNLAGRIASVFQRPITAELAASIRASNEALLRMVVEPLDVQYPSTLPIGSGNQCTVDSYNHTFFHQDDTENF